MNENDIQPDPKTSQHGEQEEQQQNEQAAPVAPEPADESQASEETFADANERRVPVSEAKRYRKRAQAAEAMLEEAKSQLARNEEQIRESEALIASLEQRMVIDELLVENESVDLEAARLLVERALAEGNAEDADSAVAELKRRKPMLFHRPRKSEAITQAVRDANGHAPHHEQLIRAGSLATESGHRHDVLRYLRLRRRN